MLQECKKNETGLAAGKPQLVVQYVPEEERPEDSETSNNGVVGE